MGQHIIFGPYSPKLSINAHAGLRWGCIHIHSLCMRATKILASLYICSDSLEAFSIEILISSKISWVGPI